MALTKIDDRGLKTPIDLLDNEKIRLGTGNDLEVFHDGSNSVIADTGSGVLQLRTSGFRVNNAANSESQISANEDGSVDLFYDGSKKLETLSNGIEVSGHIYSGDNNELRLGNVGSGGDLRIYHDGSHSRIHNVTGQLQLTTDVFRVNNAANDEIQIKADANGAVELFYDNSKKLATDSSGVEITGALIVPDGSSTGNRISIGAAGDLKIYHDGSDSYINSTGTGNLIIRGDDVHIQSTTGENMANFHEDGSVNLLYDGTASINTTATGAIFTSGTANTTLVRFGQTANRGLNISTFQSAGNNDAGVILNAADTTTSGYHAVIAFQTGGEEKARFEGQYDNFRLSNTCSGITFNGDWAAANRLNDYEEGEFNPVVSGSTSAGTFAYSAIEGHYTKIGKLVHVDIYVNQTSHDGTGDIRISTPFTCKANAQVVGSVLFDHVDFNNNFRTISSHIWGGSSLLAFYGTTDDAAWAPIPMSGNLDSSVRYIVSLTYPVA